MAIIGNIIEGKYEILKRIGKGGMSEVYLAMDQNLNKQWAVKEIRKRAGDKNNAVAVKSAMAEANLMKRLDHPCLPRIVDIINRDDVIYVVMDYIEGVSLNRVLERQGPQPQEQVIAWAKELCGALDYLHTQKPPVIYRDMKPANIILQPGGGVKLIDFGIAREYKEENLEDTVSLGTKGYAAPEQFGGKGQTDSRTDIYCLGVTLYHLVTGKNPCEPPYEIYPIRYWNPALSAGLESIILKCTQMNPEDRYSSCAELMYALEHYEEADDSYRMGQKRKLRVFAAMLVTAVVSLGTGITGQVLMVNARNQDYDSQILQAEKSVTQEEQLAYYERAVDIKPTEVTAYLGMIETFQSDAVFSLEEEARLKQKLNPHLAELREEENYADLAFALGKLYWFYYDYGRTGGGDNQLTRMKSAVQWFEDAHTYGQEDSDYYVMSQAYSQIGQFNRDITLRVEEAADQGTYAPYFKQLTQLSGLVTQEDSEIIRLEVYRLCVHAVENYARKFKADGITQEDMLRLMTDVLEQTEETVATTDKTAQLREEILERQEAVEQTIRLAYEEGNQ